MTYDPNQPGGTGDWQQQPQQPGYGQPQYQQPGYGQPQYGGAAPRTDGLAIGAMVCGIVGLLLCWCFGGILSIVAVVLGFLSRKKIQESNGQLQGEGMAMAGLITGGIGVFIMIAYWIWFFAIAGGSFYWSS